MGLHSRRKGAGGERALVKLARAAGLPADRTWHLAQSPDAGERACDVRIAGQPFQVKRQRDGFSALYEGIQDVDGLFLRADGREWLAVVRAEDYLKMMLMSPHPPAGKEMPGEK